MEERPKKGCFKVGCLGCLAMAGVALLISLAMGVLQWVASSRPSDRVVEERSQVLPATLAQLADAGGPTVLDLERPESRPPAVGVGTLQLDLAAGEFVLLPGEEGTNIEVRADYDRAKVRLVEELIEGDDGNWTYKVTVKPRIRLAFGGDVDNRIEIRIPKGRPIRIEGNLRMGRSDIELGGLWVVAVDIDVRMGDHNISVGELTAAPMDLFRVRGQMGQVRVSDLGNASPRQIKVSHQMGELRLDLSGPWAVDSELELRCRMGQCNVELPEGVRVEVDRASVIMGGRSLRLPDAEDVPTDAPTLRLDLRGSMGELRVY